LVFLGRTSHVAATVTLILCFALSGNGQPSRPPDPQPSFDGWKAPASDVDAGIKQGTTPRAARDMLLSLLLVADS
jgi:hypothetical protein